MSEKLNTKHESNNQIDYEAKKHHEKAKKDVEKRAKSARHEHSENIDDIRSKIETEAVDKKEHDKNTNEREKSEQDQPILVNKELKDIAYKRTLKRTQSKLSLPSKAFSKVIHQPVVDNVSEMAGKTVARPSGILMGGIFSFIGSSLFLWAARHYGFEYNFLLFVLFFIGGFFVGLLIELLYKLARTKN